jgi:hypothetical protein
MADRSAGDSFGKIALGGVVGFALYFLASGLGFGKRGRSAEGELPADPEPLLFRLSSRGLFLIPHRGARDEEGQKMTNDQAIKRIVAGKRGDVRLIVTGAAITDDVEKLKSDLRAASIHFSILEIGASTSPSALPSVSGNARGCYGHNTRRGWSVR